MKENKEKYQPFWKKSIFPIPEGFHIYYFTQKFKDQELEKKFLSEYAEESKSQVRYASIASGILFGIFLLLDYKLLPEMLKGFVIIRFGVVIPFAMLIIWLTYQKIFKRIFQLLMCFLTALAGSGINAMIYLGKFYPESPVSSTYFAGLILVFIFGYNFLKLRFWWSSLAGLIIIIGYEIVLFGFLDLPGKTEFLSNFFLISGNFMGMFSAYHYEFNIRKNFFLKLRLEEEKLKVVDLNLNLEQKVGERTSELEKATKRAVESDQLKTRFLANISHEIRTPMNGILGFSELLLNPEIKPEKRVTYIEVINERGKYLLGILNNLIDISMIETNNLKINPEVFELNDFMTTLKSFLDSYFVGHPGSLILETQITGTSVYLKTDRVKLEQILTNLVNNASKYAKDKDVRFGYEVRNGNIRFFVRDEGPGIPDELKPFLFESFTSGDNHGISRKSSAGLGLAISRGLTEFLGGTISYTSVKNKGTTFTIEFRYKELVTEEMPDDPGEQV